MPPLMPMGWGITDEATQKKLDIESATFDRLAAAMPYRFAQRAPKPKNEVVLNKVRELMKADGYESGFLFRYLEKAVFGDFFNWLPQRIGSCVASGGGRADTWRMISEVHVHNDPESLLGGSLKDKENVCPYLPYSYRAGRRLIPFNGYQYGSLCMKHITGKQESGVLMCSDPGLNSDAYPETQDDNKYREWGANDNLFNRFKPTVRLLESERVTSSEQSKDLLTNHLKPHQICSGLAFRYVKDVGGHPIYDIDPNDEWQHNMTVAGWVSLVDGNEYIDIDNQWGKFHKGRASFLIPRSTYDRYLSKAQCQSIGNFDLPDNPAPFPNPDA